MTPCSLSPAIMAKHSANIRRPVTAYDEEVHVPLLMVSSRLFVHPRIVQSVGRQIDIAPTVLDLLGYHPPAEWQGTSLLSGIPPLRAFMLAVKGDYLFGLIGGG